MAKIARNEASDCTSPIIDIFLRKNGTLMDPYVLEFVVFDVSTIAKQASPVQVYPGSGRQAVDLNDCPTGDRLSLGRYVAEWTVGPAEPTGTHRITWFFKETAGSAEKDFSEEFEVFDTAVASPPALYLSVQDIRDCGVDETVATDGQIVDALTSSQAFLEKATRQWFAPRDVTFKVDGNNSDTLFFSVPVIDVTYIKLNSDPNNLDTSLYEVYSNSSLEDDRQNPKLCLKRSSGDIYSSPVTSYDRPLIFKKGRMNQEISGTFGYVESDGSTPEQIKRALKILTIERLTTPIYLAPNEVLPNPPPSGATGDVIAEDTDGHRIKYSFVKFSDERPGLSGITSNREVLNTIKMYKGPIGISVPNNWIP